MLGIPKVLGLEAGNCLDMGDETPGNNMLLVEIIGVFLAERLVIVL